MKKALIVGGAGFVGQYMVKYLLGQACWDVSVTKMPHENPILPASVSVFDLDILDSQTTANLLQSLCPDVVFHLAAQSSVSLSWKNPGLTIDVNVKGAVNLLDAVRGLEKSPRVLLIGSGEEYGKIRPEEVPVMEENVLRPGNIYAATKSCQNMIGKIYADAYGLDIIMVRAFNHIGPGQSPLFVAADFCKQVAEIEAGKREPVLTVGNLEARRDFTDVEDVVEAYLLLIEQGSKGETYNIGSGNAIAVKELLNQILSLSTVSIKIETDPAKLRPSDIPVIEADISKIRSHTGWCPKISLSDTLKRTLDYWRTQV